MSLVSECLGLFVLVCLVDNLSRIKSELKDINETLKRRSQ